MYKAQVRNTHFNKAGEVRSLARACIAHVRLGAKMLVEPMGYVKTPHLAVVSKINRVEFLRFADVAVTSKYK